MLFVFPRLPVPNSFLEFSTAANMRNKILFNVILIVTKNQICVRLGVCGNINVYFNVFKESNITDQIY